MTLLDWAVKHRVLLLEPREVYDKCLVGITDSPSDDWDRQPGHVVAEYSIPLCIEALLQEEQDMDPSDAADWFYRNTYSAWLGQGTPTFVRRKKAKKEPKLQYLVNILDKEQEET
jgi:hypothetical protein